MYFPKIFWFSFIKSLIEFPISFTTDYWLSGDRVRSDESSCRFVYRNSCDRCKEFFHWKVHVAFLIQAVCRIVRSMTVSAVTNLIRLLTALASLPFGALGFLETELNRLLKTLAFCLSECKTLPDGDTVALLAGGCGCLFFALIILITFLGSSL